MLLLRQGKCPHTFIFVSLKQGADSSCSPSLLETNANGIYFAELVKEDGTLGFSITVKVIRNIQNVNS